MPESSAQPEQQGGSSRRDGGREKKRGRVEGSRTPSIEGERGEKGAQAGTSSSGKKELSGSKMERAKSEKERREKIRNRILDLRDILLRPHFRKYLVGQEDTVDRDMNKRQTLDFTVKLLEAISAEMEERELQGRGVPGDSSKEGREDQERPGTKE